MPQQKSSVHFFNHFLKKSSISKPHSPLDESSSCTSVDDYRYRRYPVGSGESLATERELEESGEVKVEEGVEVDNDYDVLADIAYTEGEIEAMYCNNATRIWRRNSANRDPEDDFLVYSVDVSMNRMRLTIYRLTTFDNNRNYRQLGFDLSTWEIISIGDPEH